MRRSCYGTNMRRHLKIIEGDDGMNSVQWSITSPIGPLYLVASAQGLKGIFWKRQTVPAAKSLTVSTPEVEILSQTVRQLEEYFRSQRRSFDLPLDVKGTDFQKCVWRELSKIPYGQTVSYSHIAHNIKKDKAVRAVGTANGKN